ncbi:hypothetical protein ABT160_05490 [Streptomyces sp. NPDC001941]|uniref:hypothetical protein n=1 Tax=Streptomyces sp. NPDC001941 TaxID=3154659 RepID=UPI00332FBE27
MDEGATGPDGAGSASLADGAAWLYGRLRYVTGAVFPESSAVLVRQWTDPVRLRDPEPVGERALFMLALGAADRPAGVGPGAVADAFTAAGWQARLSHRGVAGETWATARHGEFQVSVYEGAGPGVLTLTGWTPVVFSGRALRQPRYTLSTVDRVLCDECHGWTACMDCEGSGRAKSVGDDRCWCWGGRGGPGSCIDCGGTGSVTVEAAAWRRRQAGLPVDEGAGGGDPSHGTPPERGWSTDVAALAEVAQRACACGEFRCRWRNIVVEDDGHRICRFSGTCTWCGAQRGYAFALPPAPPRPGACDG